MMLDHRDDAGIAHQGRAEIVVRVGVARLQLDRPLEVAERVRVPAESGKCIAEMVLANLR